jgi:methylphosphotriester-DNA--protein-cysteine methyltransferase
MSDLVDVTTRKRDASAIADSVPDLPAQTGSQPQLCGALLGARAHVCAFFRDKNEEARALLPFIKEGLTAGEKIVHTIDPVRRADHMIRFTAAGIDFAAAHSHGQGRVERAKELLPNSKLSLSDVALACGFGDQSHFTRTFTATVRLSPGVWRRLQSAP